MCHVFEGLRGRVLNHSPVLLSRRSCSQAGGLVGTAEIWQAQLMGSPCMVVARGQVFVVPICKSGSRPASYSWGCCDLPCAPRLLLIWYQRLGLC